MERKQVGKYTIVEKVGEGAMGAVYKAHDPTLHRYVAIKTINDANDADPDHRKRFLREARSAAQLIHPNIVTVFDFGEDEGRFFMAMELLEGADLKSLIRKKNPLPLSEKLRIMEQICEGVGHAHAKGIVHRDLKPGNIHVQPDGKVKILDFGLARVASSDITKTGLVMGTPNYMSPEQVQAQEVDSRSDVFSLGAVFYELLSNHKPFEADSMHATLYKVAQAEREPISRYAPNLPQNIISILDKALSKDPGARYQNGHEFLRSLQEIRERLGSALDADDIWSTDQMETLVEPVPQAGKMKQRSSQRSVPLVSKPLSSPGPEPGSKGTLRTSQLSPSRPWLAYAGAALALIALGGFAYTFFSSPQTRDRDGEFEAEGATATDEATAASQIERASQSLEAKEFARAIAIAETILESEPNHEEALRIRNEAQRTLDQLNGALEEADALLASGQAKPASRALAVALAINPDHPRAVALSSKLNSQFQQEADEAHRDAERSRQAAATAGASSRGDFEQGVQLLAQGNEQLELKEYALAAQKFLGARDFFQRARNEKGQAVAQRARLESEDRSQWQDTEQRWRELRADNRSGDVTRQPAYGSALSLENQAKQLAAQGKYKESAGVYQQAINQVLEAKAQALSEREARQAEAARKARIAESLPPPPTPEPAPEPTPPPTSSIPQEELDANAIRDVISTWVRAIETQDVALYRSVKPNLSGEDEGRLRASFRVVESQQIDISIRSLDIQGARATVRIMRSDTIVGNGSRHSNQVEQTLTLSKQSGKWVISDIGS